MCSSDLDILKHNPDAVLTQVKDAHSKGLISSELKNELTILLTESEQEVFDSDEGIANAKRLGYLFFQQMTNHAVETAMQLDPSS